MAAAINMVHSRLSPLARMIVSFGYMHPSKNNPGAAIRSGTCSAPPRAAMRFCPSGWLSFESKDQENRFRRSISLSSWQAQGGCCSPGPVLTRELSKENQSLMKKIFCSHPRSMLAPICTGAAVLSLKALIVLWLARWQTVLGGCAAQDWACGRNRWGRVLGLHPPAPPHTSALQISLLELDTTRTSPPRIKEWCARTPLLVS